MATDSFQHLPPPPSGSGPGSGADGSVAVVRTNPSLNAAWLAVGSVVAVLSLMMGINQTVGLLAHEEYTTSFTVDDPSVSVLSVKSDDGVVEVIGADVSAITVTAKVSDGLKATDLTHEVVGNRLEIRVRCNEVLGGPWCQAGLRIVVPRNLEVQVHSDDDRVSVRGLSGRVDADSSNGPIEAEALSGSASLRSDNGSVRATRLRTESVEATSSNGSVRLEFDRAPLSAIVRSDNGSVEVSVPRDEKAYAVELDSDNGGIDNQVHTDSASDRRIVATSNNGSVTVRYLD